MADRIAKGCAWLMVLALAGCASRPVPLPPPPEVPPVPGDNPVCVSCSGLLDVAELADVESKAERNDPEAAFQLAAHYQVLDDFEKFRYWDLRAANLGHPVAQYDQWLWLKESTDCIDRKAALTWLEKSAAQGLSVAKNELVDFRKAADSCK